ncbi:hypothetical protein E2C01_023960 [Portunus trituberculatus]|uniref:Uncharacterized protein n=1 Tax=Portunus trituberculatus TaxID=210409 RepID=A0A5B7E982_PORTR|nr:hypothetical protein [Portunus trituberculatus]
MSAKPQPAAQDRGVGEARSKVKKGQDAPSFGPRVCQNQTKQGAFDKDNQDKHSTGLAATTSCHSAVQYNDTTRKY